MIGQDYINENDDFKSACCNFYENSILQTLLGPSFHPGGLELTKELGLAVNLSSTDSLLDIASGLGTSAIYLAEEFKSNITGIDFSSKNVNFANDLVKQKGLENFVNFKVSDVNELPFESDFFDVVLIECSFCLFQNKRAVGDEIYRVLKPNGRLIITDIAIEKKLPFNVEQMIFQVACISNAQSMAKYTQYIESSGFKIHSIEGRNSVLTQMIADVKRMIFVAELASGLKKINLGSINLKEVKYWIKEGKKLINEGHVTYMIMIAHKSN